jgi:hypothetical protein
MKKTIILSTSLLILAGCATPPAPVVKRDVEPILVGIPLEERVAKSSKAIYEQMDLLNQVQAKKNLGPYHMVEHNNGLDARKGSSRTLPQAYAVTDDSSKEIGGMPNDPKLQLKLKRIDWEDNSANMLGKEFAKTLGYSFVVNGDRDLNISLKIENETLESAINKFKVALQPNATVLLVEKNQTFNIIYRK